MSTETNGPHLWMIVIRSSKVKKEGEWKRMILLVLSQKVEMNSRQKIDYRKLHHIYVLCIKRLCFSDQTLHITYKIGGIQLYIYSVHSIIV